MKTVPVVLDSETEMNCCTEVQFDLPPLIVGLSN